MSLSLGCIYFDDENYADDFDGSGGWGFVGPFPIIPGDPLSSDDKVCTLDEKGEYWIEKDGECVWSNTDFDKCNYIYHPNPCGCLENTLEVIAGEATYLHSACLKAFGVLAETQCRADIVPTGRREACEPSQECKEIFHHTYQGKDPLHLKSAVCQIQLKKCRNCWVEDVDGKTIAESDTFALSLSGLIKGNIGVVELSGGIGGEWIDTTTETIIKEGVQGIGVYVKLSLLLTIILPPRLSRKTSSTVHKGLFQQVLLKLRRRAIAQSRMQALLVVHLLEKAPQGTMGHLRIDMTAMYTQDSHERRRRGAEAILAAIMEGQPEASEVLQ